MKLRHPTSAPFAVDIPSLGVTVAPGETFDGPADLAGQGFERVEADTTKQPKPKPKEA